MSKLIEELESAMKADMPIYLSNLLYRAKRQLEQQNECETVIGELEWSVSLKRINPNYETYIDSENLAHDARLTLSGNFESASQAYHYAEMLSKKLNWNLPAPPKGIDK